MTKKWQKTSEVRLNNDGSIDEIFAPNVSVHLEQMDDGFWWLGLRRKNGETLRINLFAKNGRAHIGCNAESDDGSICAGFTTR